MPWISPLDGQSSFEFVVLVESKMLSCIIVCLPA